MTAQSLRGSVRDHGITSLRVLQHGEVVYTAGAQDVPLPIHSVRKSIVSALFGQLVDDGLVRLDTTLADLGIDESPELTPMEASATLEHLLTSSSGVYLPLKFDPPFDVFGNTVAPWPTRGSSVPGTRFHYSNWDFNALGEIYQRVSSTALFVAVDRQLAQPLNFRDWDPLKHSHLYYAPDPLGATARFPNYAMQLSARDLAAFGQLYLDGGAWQGQQIVPADWVRHSTRPLVRTGLPNPFGHYGYLWWAVGENGGSVLPAGSYSAMGQGGQTLSVVPSLDLVIVTMSEPTEGGNTEMAIPDVVLSAILSLAPSDAVPSVET
jgi:CubicO group peptidase (beta-lactamase class C family)